MVLYRQADIGPVPASVWHAGFWLPGLSQLWSISGWELTSQDLFATTQPDQDHFLTLCNGPIQASQHWPSTGISLAFEFLVARVQPALVRFWLDTGMPGFICHNSARPRPFFT